MQDIFSGTESFGETQVSRHEKSQGI